MTTEWQINLLCILFIDFLFLYRLRSNHQNDLIDHYGIEDGCELLCTATDIDAPDGTIWPSLMMQSMTDSLAASLKSLQSSLNSMECSLLCTPIPPILQLPQMSNWRLPLMQWIIHSWCLHPQICQVIRRIGSNLMCDWVRGKNGMLGLFTYYIQSYQTCAWQSTSVPCLKLSRRGRVL